VCSSPIAERVGATKFLGYEATAGKSKIVALVADGREVDTVGTFSKGVAVVTAETPFYGEQGGQMGDTGTLASASAKMIVRDCKRPVSTLWVHVGEVQSGELRVGDTVDLAVDAGRRDDIRRNHSATHLLHWALRHVLGHARHAEGLAGRPRSPALRLLALGAAVRRGEAARGGPRQRARAQERRRRHRGAADRRGEAGGARSRSSARSTATACAS
jgi:hypothetical protein